MSRWRPRFSLGHKLYAVALLLTVIALMAGFSAYLPLTKTTGQVEAAEKEIASSMAVERLGRAVGEWLWQVNVLVVNGPDDDRSHVTAAHLVALDALRTWEASEAESGEAEAGDLERVQATGSAMTAVKRWVDKIESAVEQDDRISVVRLFTDREYASAVEQLALSLDGFIRREHNEMREAFVQLAGAAAAAGPIAQASLTGHVLDARREVEMSIYASAFVRSRLVHGQLMAVALSGSPVFDPTLLGVMQTFVTNDFQNWRGFADKDGPKSELASVRASTRSLAGDEEKLNAVSGAIGRLIATAEMSAARALFAEELTPALNRQIAAVQAVIDEHVDHAARTSSLLVRDARRISLIVAALAALILALAFASARTARRTARRLTQTTRAMREISRDDLEARVPADGSDELAQLADAFNERMDDLAEAREAERSFLKQTVETAEAERMRLAAELHDGPIQRLTGLLYRVELMSARIGHGTNGQVSELVDETQTKISAEIATLRNLLSELRPPVLDERGLGPALQDYLSDFSTREGIECKLDVQLEGRVAEALETTMYRVAQEALANVGRHANATHVNLALMAENGSIRLLVSDDGVGFETGEDRYQSDGQHFGLTGMRERVRMVGGEFDLESVPGVGTTVRAKFPRSMREAS